MKSWKIYTIFNKIIHIMTPLSILIFSYILNLCYNKNDDPGGWGGLALATNILISIGWILTICFITFISNLICKKEHLKEIIKLIISILNILIWISNTDFLVHNNIMITANTLLVIVMTILLLLKYTLQKSQ